MSIDSGNRRPVYDHSARALVVAESAGGDSAVESLVRARCQYPIRIGFAEAARDIGRFDALDLLLIEAADAPEAMLDMVLARADALAQDGALAVVVTVAPEQIDSVAAQLHGRRTQILVAPSDAESLVAISAARWDMPAQVGDVSRDAESARLHRLNEEVARIADTLAQLTRDDAHARGVRAPSISYRGPDDAAPADASAQEIRAVIRARRLRDQFFAPALFGDPAWDMLLDLFAAGLERRTVSVSSLCIAAAVPPTTALRWIGTMHEAGLFERRADPSDRRRAYVGLSSKGNDGMRAYVSAVKRAGLPLV